LNKKKVIRWLVAVTAAAVLILLIIRHHHVLDSAELEAAIQRELPSGCSKAQVISFIRARHPMFYDDLGTEVKARISGLANNMIYDKDIVLVFAFDANGRLLSHSSQETLSFF
jgi:hypothetical protein